VPLINDGGEHLGYKVQNDEQPRFALLLKPEAQQREITGDIAVVLDSETFRFDGWVENEDGGSWETAFTIDLAARGSVSGLALLAYQSFDAEAFLQMARASGNVEELAKAIRSELTEPSGAFIQAIRARLEAN